MITIINPLTLVSKLQSTMLLVILLLSAVEGRCADTWLYQQPVVYSENHDPSIVYLDDGRQLEVQYGPEIEWEEVNKWQKGKKLSIAYNLEKGAILLDISTGKSIPILSGLEKHPLDILKSKRMEKNISTMDMVSTMSDFTKLWDKEMNRALGALKKTLDRSGKRTIQDSQEAWKKFRDAEVKMLIKIHNEREGTIQSIVIGSRIQAITRDRAIQINGYLSPF